MKESKELLTLKALTSAHVGSGDTIATIDLPIQREKHTNYPTIYASSLKGAIRDQFRDYVRNNGNNDINNDINFIFGYDEQDDSNNKKNEKASSSLVSFSDARLFAFPMRSTISPFVLVTCPFVLKRLSKDLELISIKYNNMKESIINDNNTKEQNPIQNISLNESEAIFSENYFTNKIVLEEGIVNLREKNGDEKNIKDFINKIFPSIKNILIVSDQMFDYCVTCTEIQTNIKINSETGITETGSLRYQEFLPSESILYSIVWFGHDETTTIQDDTIKKSVKKAVDRFIQIGGDKTLGKGIFEVEWYSNDNN